MAIRTTSTSNYLSRTTSVPTGNFTFCCWLKIFTAPNGFATIFWRGTTTDNTEMPFFGIENSSPQHLHLYEGANDHTGTAAISTGVWYHIALVRNSSTDWKVYLNGVQDITAATESGTTPNEFGFLFDRPFQVGNANLDGAIAAVKLYDTNLTQSEIQQEMMQYLPFRTANLNSFFPLLSAAEKTTDFSGAALDMTATGSLTTEDGPPIPWKQARRRMFVPAAAAGGAQTVTLAFVSSSEQIFTPAVTLNLTPGFISSGEQIFTPTVTQNVLPGFIASSEQVFTPTVTQNVTPGFIASGEQIFAPTVSQNVTLSAIATTEQVFTPVISQNVLLGAIASGEQVFSINASFGLTITLGFIPSGEQIFSPTITQKVLLPAIATTAQVFTLAVSTPSNGDPEPNIDITISFSGPCYDVSLSGSNYDCDLNGSKLDVSFR